MKHSTIRKFFAAAALACLCLPVLQSCGGYDPAEDWDFTKIARQGIRLALTPKK